MLPAPRADKLQSREIADDVLHKAIALKQEHPGRSVRQIITILELAPVTVSSEKTVNESG
ncbi:Uncharacterised protein [Chlamydia abortus]|uniref:hypothetical protein n=1 Tax=unclassified Paenibacillus TaxID=185978 RepID=UPI000A27F0B6|nr:MULTISPECIES: hypothetical protein [Paenibacillaceae]SHE10498.1 Uncharacterised protein [Chlamydia abortus]